MPTLEWIGKDKVINHHQDVPYRILDEKYTFNSTKSENKIIHGDNLDALKALLPEYEGKIKCIYIDPPYNTGEEGWVYNDNVNDPKIKKWLGEVVGKEGEDLSRHDKWLCMMYPRLKLLQKLLSDDGAIFISIDDNELANLKLICDEIFGANNFLTQIIVQSNKRGQTYNQIAKTHNFILIYKKNPDVEFNMIEKTTVNDDLNLIDDIGKYNIREIRNRNPKFGKFNRPNLFFPIYVNPSNPDKDGLLPISLVKSDDYCIEVLPYNSIKNESCWRWGRELFQKNINPYTLKSNVVAKPVKSGGYNIYEKYRKTKYKAKTIWFDNNMITEHGTVQLGQIGLAKYFQYPKPVELITRCIELGAKSDSIILDSFAGSGTTAHAVLNLNKKDGGNRKFILVEMGDYAENITAERVKRVISGYSCDNKDTIYDEEITLKSLKNGEKMINDSDIAKSSVKDNYSKFEKEIIDSHLVVTGTRKSFEDGTGGDFTYYELGEPLLTPDGNLNENIDTDKIRNYIWFTETSTSLPVNKKINDTKYYLGTNNDTSYYFAYEKDKLTDLNYQLLTEIKTKTDNYVIYADTCTLSQKELTKLNITFRKIPRDITKL